MDIDITTITTAPNAVRFGPDPQAPGTIITLDWDDDMASCGATEAEAQEAADHFGLPLEVYS